MNSVCATEISSRPIQYTGRACLDVLIVLFGCLGSAACSGHNNPTPTYAPGLGEIMTFTQMRHAKLWMAGEAENWELAALKRGAQILHQLSHFRLELRTATGWQTQLPQVRRT
jgi:hypothetical protein